MHHQIGKGIGRYRKGTGADCHVCVFDTHCQATSRGRSLRSAPGLLSDLGQVDASPLR